MLKLIVILVPVGLDTFVVSAALGAAGLPARRRMRTSLLFMVFEGGMPLVGLVLGSSLSAAIGSGAEYVAIAMLLGLGGYVLLIEDDEAEEQRLSQLAGSVGIGTILLGLSISIDELAIGFSLGLLHLPKVAALIFITLQAFIVSQVGLRLGRRVNEGAREKAEGLVGVGLILVALFLLAEQLLASE